MPRLSRRNLLRSGLAGLGAAAVAPHLSAAPASAVGLFTGRYDHILGTSLDLYLVAESEAAAVEAERAVLEEIERLRQIFSTYDPDSELSRLNRATGPVPASPELRGMLNYYEVFQTATGGACHAQLGELVRAWHEAAGIGVEPDGAALARRLDRPGWFHDARAGTVTRLTDAPLNLNAGAKGYILDRAKTVAAKVPGVRGGLVNCGGDINAWGNLEWTVGVQNPTTPADNAVPLTAIRLTSGAVATSAGYQRGVTVAGRHYSHLIDPRTGWPADHIASATVVAPTSLQANLFATSLCILSPEEGLALRGEEPGFECLIVPTHDDPIRSPGFAALEVPVVADDPPKKDDPAKPAGEPWPDEFQVSFALELPRPAGGRYKRPYVCIWIEDAENKPVRTVTVWGNHPRWLPEMSVWWKFAKGKPDLVKAVTRATRAPGKYEVVWDGKDDAGNSVGRGKYTVKVEVHREHGKHLTQTGILECGADAAELKLAKNAEAGETVVTYGKKK